MNLAIGPINCKANCSQTQNCRKNSQQNFDGLKSRLLPHATEKQSDIVNTFVVKKRDILIDKFIGHFDNAAKKIGLNTENLEKKGYHADFVPEYPNSSKLIMIFKDAKDGIVSNAQKNAVCIKVRNDNVENQAANFANQVKNLPNLYA